MDNIDAIPETLADSTTREYEKAWEIYRVTLFPAFFPVPLFFVLSESTGSLSTPKMRISVMGSPKVWNIILPVNTVKYQNLHIADSQKMLINCFREMGRTWI